MPFWATAYKKLAAGYEGLELKWFANLRTALGSYFCVAGGVGNPDLEAAFKSQVDELTQQIKSLERPSYDRRNPEDRRPSVLAGKCPAAPELVREVRSRFSAPNFHAQIGGELLELGVGGPD